MRHQTFIFKRTYTCQYGKIKSGTELSIVNDTIYINSGMIEPAYYRIFRTLIDNDELRNLYLVEKPMVYNKV